MKTHHQYPTPLARRAQTAIAPASAEHSPEGPDTITHYLHRHWPQLKIILKEQYLVLTDDDLTLPHEGAEEFFLTHLERKTGRHRTEFEHLILIHGGSPFD